MKTRAAIVWLGGIMTLLVQSSCQRTHAGHDNDYGREQHSAVAQPPTSGAEVVEATELVAPATSTSATEGPRAAWTSRLLDPSMSAGDREQLIALLRGQGNPDLAAAVQRADALLTRCLAAVRAGQVPNDFRHAVRHLGSCLEPILADSCQQLRGELERLRGESQREGITRLRKLERAIDSRDQPSSTLLRLKQNQTEALARLGDQADAVDRAIVILTRQQTTLRDAIAIWGDPTTIAVTSVADCDFLREDFVSVCQGTRYR